jgi:hypothetical protein
VKLPPLETRLRLGQQWFFSGWQFHLLPYKTCNIFILDPCPHWRDGYSHISFVASTDTALVLTGTVDIDLVVGDVLLLVTSGFDDVVVMSVEDDDLLVVVVGFVEENTLVVGLTVVGFTVVGFS